MLFNVCVFLRLIFQSPFIIRSSYKILSKRAGPIKGKEIGGHAVCNQQVPSREAALLVLYLYRLPLLPKTALENNLIHLYCGYFASTNHL